MRTIFQKLKFTLDKEDFAYLRFFLKKNTQEEFFSKTFQRLTPSERGSSADKNIRVVPNADL